MRDRLQPGEPLPLPQRALALAALGQVVAELAGAVVHRRQLLGQPLHGLGQRRERQLEVGPVGVAAVRGQRHRAQDRAQRRPLHEGDVGVPDVGEPVVRAVEGVDLLVRVVDPGHHRVRHREAAHPVAECHLAVGVELLAGEEQHLVVRQRLPDGGDRLVVRGGQVQAAHLGAETRSEPVDVELDRGRGGDRTIQRAGHGSTPFPGSGTRRRPVALRTGERGRVGPAGGVARGRPSATERRGLQAAQVDVETLHEKEPGGHDGDPRFAAARCATDDAESSTRWERRPVVRTLVP